MAEEYKPGGGAAHREKSVELPAPTAWPLVLAVGITFAVAGMVTSPGVSILGGILLIAGCIGWFRDVFPHPRHETVPIEDRPIEFTTTRRSVARVYVNVAHRARIPVETPSIVAGIKGGIAGGIVMAILAVLYGVFRYHSVWYAVNLMGGAGVAGWSHPSLEQLLGFRLEAFIAALVIHVVVSLLVGLVYGALLPMLPRHPILLGGVLAPLLWTGFMHSSMDLINPYLDQHINWPWFVVCQIAFGLVAGWVVAKQAKIHTAQYLPFAARAGIETPGFWEHSEQKDKGKGDKGE